MDSRNQNDVASRPRKMISIPLAVSSHRCDLCVTDGQAEIGTNTGRLLVLPRAYWRTFLRHGATCVRTYMLIKQHH